MQKNVDQYENHDRSIRLQFDSSEHLHSFISIVSHRNNSSSPSLISPIVNFQTFPNENLSIEITFQHQIDSTLFNDSNVQFVCVQWKETQDNDLRWSPDACRLLTRNDTHSICSCQTSTSVALLLDHLKVDAHLFLIMNRRFFFNLHLFFF